MGREVLDEAWKAVAVGVTTDEIDRVVHEATVDRECYPSPLNYYQVPQRSVYSECLNTKRPKSKLLRNPNGREFRFRTNFWSFKLNATSSDSFIAIDRVQF